MLNIQPSDCVVCGVETTGMKGRCTNGCCRECHHMHCSLGGSNGRGHRLSVAVPKKPMKKESK